MILAQVLHSVPHLIAIVLLAGASAFLSAGETAIFSLSRKQLALLRQSHRFADQLVLRLREEPASLLATIVLGNTTVNIIMYTLMAVTCANLSRGSPLASTALGAIGFVLVVLGAEVLPKLLAFVAAPRLAPIVAIPFRTIQVLTGPLRYLLGDLLVEPLGRVIAPHPAGNTAILPEELQELVGVSSEQGLIDARETTMLHKLMSLSHARVSDFMVPRVDVVAFDLANDPAELATLIRQSRLLRIPVYEETIDNVVGVIHAKEFLLDPNRHPHELARRAYFIPEQARVEALLQHFKSTGTQSVLVVDEYGGLAGVVAMEDIVEEIVGELYAPEERYTLPSVRRIDETTFDIDADLNVDDFSRAFDLSIEESRFTTVAGLIVAALNRAPLYGDETRIGESVLSIVKMHRRRILRARLCLPRPPEENAELTRLLGTLTESDSTPSMRIVS